jgi:hypothetical protein
MATQGQAAPSTPAPAPAGPAVISEVPVSLATEKDIPHIVRNPTRYGFKWKHEAISAYKDNDGKLLANGSKLELRKDAPRLEIVDLILASKWFGAESVMKRANGTSYDVESEGIVRTEILKHWHGDRKLPVQEFLKTELVKRQLLGIRASGGGGSTTRYVANDGTSFRTSEEAAAHNAKITPAVFKGFDGVEYSTKLEAQQASVDFLVKNGTPVAAAQAAVVNM